MAQIVWFTSDQELVVQFQDIGEYNHFKTVLAQFKALSRASWSREKHSWKLPVEDFPKLVRFADRQSIRLVWAGYGEKPENLPLF
jgi:hypothetical protein